MISFVYGDPDPGSLPIEDMALGAEFLAENQHHHTLSYAIPIADQGLTAELAKKANRDYGLTLSAREIVITPGASSALGLVCDLLLDPGDTVLADAPAWMGATDMFKLAGAQVVGIEMDEDGPIPAAVEAALEALAARRRTPKFFYTIPTFQNPSGTETSLERRRALARIADERGLLILEDDAYVDLRFSGEPKPTIFGLAQPGSVLFFGTLSKTIAAGMRLGWCAGPAEIVDTLSRARVDAGLRNTYTAALAEWYLASGRFDGHLQELRAIYHGKCLAMLDALAREMPEGTHWTRPNGGFFIWVTLPGVDAVDIRTECRENGVDYIAGPAFFSDGSGRQALRLAYSAVSIDEINKGISRLAAVVRRNAPVAAPAG
jgi:2-aminoadipate transaminase